MSILEVADSMGAALASTPQMGWNSWNKFHCNVTQDLIQKEVDNISTLGLDKLGYTYVNIDDCW
jgi:alpha-galactosidase